MNPPSREIRVLFVPPRLRVGGESPISLRTPLTFSKTPRRFPESLVLQPLASPSAYTHARTHTTNALSFSHSGFHSLEISRSQYALTTPYNQQRLIPSRLFAYVSHDEQGDENAVAASGGNQGDSCSRMRRGITAMILRVSDKQRKRAGYYMSHE